MSRTASKPNAAGPATDLEAALDALHAGAFDAFVASRNQLAQTLKKEGQVEASLAVKALEKPTLAAWAVNQLHRKEPRAFAALLGVASALRGAEGALMQGGEALRAVTQKQRTHVDALVGYAREILVAAGHNPTDVVLDRIAHTLRSLAVTGWGSVVPGRLAHDLTPPGLDALVEALGGLALPPVDRSRANAEPSAAPAPAKTGAPKDDAHAKAVAETKREAERARREAEEALAAAELALGRAERERERAKENVAAAEAAARRAKEKAHAARIEAEEAEHRAEKAEAQLAQAHEELAATKSAAQEAERARDHAKKHLRQGSAGPKGVLEQR